MSLTLTDDELVALTGYRRAAEQLRTLRAMGFWRARRNPLGQVVLERAHYESVCRGGDLRPDAPAHRPQLRAA